MAKSAKKKKNVKISEINGKFAAQEIANEFANFNESLCGPSENQIEPEDIQLERKIGRAHV